MLATTRCATSCDICGGSIAAGALTYRQPATAGFAARHRHVACPPPAVAPGVYWLGDVVPDVLDEVELSGWPPDEPVPFVLTATGAAAVSWG